jgi:hypothetical protein
MHEFLNLILEVRCSINFFSRITFIFSIFSNDGYTFLILFNIFSISFFVIMKESILLIIFFSFELDCHG